MESARTLLERLSEARKEADEPRIANLAYKLGGIYLEQGKWDRAHPLLDESYEICLRHENDLGAAMAATSLATLLLQTDRPGEAQALAEKARAYFKENLEVNRTTGASLLLGDTLWAQGRPAEALPFYQEAVEICEAHEDVLGSATLLDRLATMHRLLDQDDQALSCFQRALASWHKLAVPDREAFTLTHLGDILAGRGDLSRAAALYEQALELYRHLKNHSAGAAVEKELARLAKHLEHRHAEEEV